MAILKKCRHVMLSGSEASRFVSDLKTRFFGGVHPE
jgi:hypothetical protein